MTVSAINRYSVRYYPSGVTANDVIGVVWAIGPKEIYFDEYKSSEERKDWVQRFNEVFNQDAKSNIEIKKIIGVENFQKFKKEYVQKHLPRIDKFVCLDKND